MPQRPLLTLFAFALTLPACEPEKPADKPTKDMKTTADADKKTDKIEPKIDPAKDDPAKVEPAKDDPTKAEPTDPAKDPAKPDPAKDEPAKDAAKPEPAKGS